MRGVANDSIVVARGQRVAVKCIEQVTATTTQYFVSAGLRSASVSYLNPWQSRSSGVSKAWCLSCRGWTANTIKVVPQNAIRLVSYETLKGLLHIRKSKTDT